MKVKLQTLVDSTRSLESLAEQKLQARLAYSIGIVIGKVNPHVVSYQKAVEGLKERYFTPIPDNPEMLRLTEDKEQRASYRKEMEELADTEVELDGIGKIKSSVITENGGTLNARDFYLLDWLIAQDMETLFEIE